MEKIGVYNCIALFKRFSILYVYCSKVKLIIFFTKNNAFVYVYVIFVIYSTEVLIVLSNNF